MLFRSRLENRWDILERGVADGFGLKLVRRRVTQSGRHARAGQAVRVREQVSRERPLVGLRRAIAVDEARAARQRVVKVGREQERALLAGVTCPPNIDPGRIMC